MSQLSGTIQKLERLKGAFNVRPFYITHLPRWQERARRIAVAILENARPVNVDAEAWRARVATESARLSALLIFSEDEAGAILGLGLRPAGTPPNDPRHFSLEGTSIGDVERWVAAGREKASPDEPGKNLDARDANKTDLPIAWRVMWALKLRKGNWEGLLGHIREFLGASEQAAAETFYAEILTAWIEQLGPEIRADFRAWFHAQLVRAMR